MMVSGRRLVDNIDSEFVVRAKGGTGAMAGMSSAIDKGDVLLLELLSLETDFVYRRINIQSIRLRTRIVMAGKIFKIKGTNMLQ